MAAVFLAGAFLAAAFFAGAFLAAVFLAGAFLAGAFLAGAFAFFASAMTFLAVSSLRPWTPESALALAPATLGTVAKPLRANRFANAGPTPLMISSSFAMTRSSHTCSRVWRSHESQ